MQTPKKFLTSKYRRDMWRNVAPNVSKMLKALPVKEVHVFGSFSSKKRRPADCDFMVLFKVGDKAKNRKWSFDFVVVPDNKHGQFVFDDAKKWMKQKYGSKNFEITRIH